MRKNVLLRRCLTMRKYVPARDDPTMLKRDKTQPGLKSSSRQRGLSFGPGIKFFHRIEPLRLEMRLVEIENETILGLQLVFDFDF